MCERMSRTSLLVSFLLETLLQRFLFTSGSDRIVRLYVFVRREAGKNLSASGARHTTLFDVRPPVSILTS